MCEIISLGAGRRRPLDETSISFADVGDEGFQTWRPMPKRV
jgi:hypothetical protein